MKPTLSLILSFLTLYIVSCSSAPTEPPPPSWITQPARTVDQGYIVYVASSEDRSAEQARFKAESQAYQDLANECSFPPKGARTEDRYVKQIGTTQTQQAFVKVAVDFQTCEEAKQAVQPDQIRKLANVAMTDQIKAYQTKYEAPPEGSDDEDENEAAGVSDETQAVLNAKQAPPPTYVSSPVQFYVARQQVFYYKEDVILSPPAAYPPNSPQTTQFVNQVQAPISRVQQYEAANPALKTSPQTWSTTHQQAVKSYQAARPSNRMNANRPHNGNRSGKQHPNNNGGQKKKGRRRRRNS
jgi:hypothetical protein